MQIVGSNMGAGGMGAWLGIAATFMVATKLDLYRHLAERLSFKPAQRKTLHIYQA